LKRGQQKSVLGSKNQGKKDGGEGNRVGELVKDPEKNRRVKATTENSASVQGGGGGKPASKGIQREKGECVKHTSSGFLLKGKTLNSKEKTGRTIKGGKPGNPISRKDPFTKDSELPWPLPVFEEVKRDGTTAAERGERVPAQIGEEIWGDVAFFDLIIKQGQCHRCHLRLPWEFKKFITKAPQFLQGKEDVACCPR